MYPMFGACFTPVAGGATYKLGEIKPTGITPDDAIQIIDGNDLSLVTGLYAYLDPEYVPGEEELAGWYDVLNGFVGDPTYKADDVDIKVGQAFLGNILTGATPTFQFAGEAPTVTTSVSSEGAMYPFFANYIPRAIPLNWRVPAGITPDDAIQVIDGNDLSLVTGLYAYLDPEYVPGEEELAGWYDVLNGFVGDPSYKIGDDLLIQPGDGFLGNILTGVTVNFQFPSSTKEIAK